MRRRWPRLMRANSSASRQDEGQSDHANRQNEYKLGVGCLAGGNCGGVSAFPQKKGSPHPSRFVRVVEGRTALSIETEDSCSKQPHLRFSPPSWAREAPPPSR